MSHAHWTAEQVEDDWYVLEYNEHASCRSVMNFGPEKALAHRIAALPDMEVAAVEFLATWDANARGCELDKAVALLRKAAKS